ARKPAMAAMEFQGRRVAEVEGGKRVRVAADAGWAVRMQAGHAPAVGMLEGGQPAVRDHAKLGVEPREVDRAGGAAGLVHAASRLQNTWGSCTMARKRSVPMASTTATRWRSSGAEPGCATPP